MESISIDIFDIAPGGFEDGDVEAKRPDDLVERVGYRQALQTKLEAEGWTVLSIRSDDGCYKVRATKAGGERLDAKYDPASLERVRRKQDDDDD